MHKISRATPSSSCGQSVEYHTSPNGIHQGERKSDEGIHVRRGTGHERQETEDDRGGESGEHQSVIAMAAIERAGEYPAGGRAQARSRP